MDNGSERKWEKKEREKDEKSVKINTTNVALLHMHCVFRKPERNSILRFFSAEIYFGGSSGNRSDLTEALMFIFMFTYHEIL